MANLQLDIFENSDQPTRGLKHGNIIIWNFKRCDMERFIDAGIPFEIIEDQKLECTKVGRNWEYKEK